MFVAVRPRPTLSLALVPAMLMTFEEPAFLSSHLSTSKTSSSLVAYSSDEDEDGELKQGDLTRMLDDLPLACGESLVESSVDFTISKSSSLAPKFPLKIPKLVIKALTRAELSELLISKSSLLNQANVDKGHCSFVLDGQKCVQSTFKVFHNNKIPGNPPKDIEDQLETTALMIVDKKNGKYGVVYEGNIMQYESPDRLKNCQQLIRDYEANQKAWADHRKRPGTVGLPNSK